MDTLTFKPGRAFLASESPVDPWAVVFEDEGTTGYAYAHDRSRDPHGDGILDAVLIYNVSALREPSTERLAAIQWSRDGMQAVLYLDGTAQALFDFAARETCCRSDFPNFQEAQGEVWRQVTHAWDPARFERFEAELLA